MGRKILFITTDQQRYDALGCNGGTIARTPVVDGWARAGLTYRRAYNQNTVCMPARSTMLTHRRALHHRPRRAAGRLRIHLQGAVPRRRVDAPADGVASGAVGAHRTGRDRSAGRAGRPRAHLLRHRRHCARAEGGALPMRDDASRERVLCEWDSQTPSHGMHLRSIYHRDGWLLTRYEPSTDGQPTGLERQFGDGVLAPCGIHYDGSEGELYNLNEDPLQWRNLWDDAGYRSIKSDLIADLYDHLPAERSPRLLVDAPA